MTWDLRGRGQKRTRGEGGIAVCRRCGSEGPVASFNPAPGGRVGSWCKRCRNAHADEKRAYDRELPTNAQELARLRKRLLPTAAEWEAVQRAAQCIADYLTAKANGVEQYKGKTGWAVLEELGGPAKRFHQLVSLAVVQQKVWEDTAAKRAKASPDVVKQVRALRLQKYSLANIAARLHIDKSTVGRIVKQLAAHPTNSKKSNAASSERNASSSSWRTVATAAAGQRPEQPIGSPTSSQKPVPTPPRASVE